MPQLYECEECGKAIYQDSAWLEIDIDVVPDDPKVVFKGRVHADCLERYREKHPR